MNHVLLFDTDFNAVNKVTLTALRYTHITGQLKAAVGSTIKVGLLNGNCGSAVVCAIGNDSVSLEVYLDQPPPPPSPIKLILALPRPKVLRRVLRSVVEHGVKDIHLINTWRVEKSYWHSPLLQAQALDGAIYDGLALAKDTVAPRLQQHKLFKPFVQDQLPEYVNGAAAYIAHPSTAPCPSNCRSSTWLALGPEGGFNDFEVSLLQAQGFSCISLGARILRVENAVSAALGRMNPI